MHGSANDTVRYTINFLLSMDDRETTKDAILLFHGLVVFYSRASKILFPNMRFNSSTVIISDERLRLHVPTYRYFLRSHYLICSRTSFGRKQWVWTRFKSLRPCSRCTANRCYCLTLYSSHAHRRFTYVTVS